MSEFVSAFLHPLCCPQFSPLTSHFLGNFQSFDYFISMWCFKAFKTKRETNAAALKVERRIKRKTHFWLWLFWFFLSQTSEQNWGPDNSESALSSVLHLRCHVFLSLLEPWDSYSFAFTLYFSVVYLSPPDNGYK